MSASAARPPATRITPHATPCTTPSERGRSAPRRAIAVSGMTVTTSPAAAGDIPQPSTSSSTTRKSAATSPPATRSSASVRGDRRTSGGSRDRSRLRRRAAASRRTSATRHLREEDRLPAEELRQDPAGGRAERRAEHAAATQTRSARSSSAADLREEVERGRDERAPRRPPARTARRRARRTRARARTRATPGEDDDAAANASRGRRRETYAAGTATSGEHEVEGREHPGDGRDRDVELAEDLRQRERDDRGVREREPDTDCEQPAAHGTSLGTRLPSHRHAQPQTPLDRDRRCRARPCRHVHRGRCSFDAQPIRSRRIRPTTR